MLNWLTNITNFFVNLAKDIFNGLLSFVHDAFIWVLDQFLTAIAALIALIPTPSFMASGNNFGSILSGLPPYALYVIDQLHIDQGFGIIGAGVTFYLLRKLFTLGQW